MNLLWQVRRSDRTGVNVQSNENESTLMMRVAFAHKLTLHESHISAKSERLSESGPCACPTDLGIANDAVEIGYLRWIIDLAQRYRRAGQREVMDKNAEGRRASGNRLRFRRTRLTIRPLWRP
jgi:hypothetical protein